MRKVTMGRKGKVTADLVIGDAHIGSKVGIIHPGKTGDYKPNKEQKWLFKIFHKNILPEMAAIIKDAKPDYVHGLTGGDMADIDFKNRSSYYWSTNILKIQANANDLLEPFFDMCDAVHCIKGTKSHTGENSVADEAIAENFNNVVKRDEDNYAWYRCEYILSGVLVDAQHKGKNKSKWADENLITALREEIWKDRSRNDRRIPDVAYRFHFHWFGDTSIHKKPYVVQVPSLQLPAPYIPEIDSVGRTPEVGAFVALYQNGEVVDRFPLRYTYKEEKPWRPK